MLSMFVTTPFQILLSIHVLQGVIALAYFNLFKRRSSHNEHCRKDYTRPSLLKKGMGHTGHFMHAHLY